MNHSMMIALVTVATSLGCASASSVPGVPVRNAQVITQQEIVDAKIIGTAYEVISRLRPNFLNSRGPTSIQGQAVSTFPNVYLDGVPYGDINSLRNIDGSLVGEVRMYQAWEAQTKFGMNNAAGVIAITIRK